MTELCSRPAEPAHEAPVRNEPAPEPRPDHQEGHVVTAFGGSHGALAPRGPQLLEGGAHHGCQAPHRDQRPASLGQRLGKECQDPADVGERPLGVTEGAIVRVTHDPGAVAALITRGLAEITRLAEGSLPHPRG